ncbi:MAG: UbiA family prenyltransferase [Haloarculaceae archaeon]
MITVHGIARHGNAPTDVVRAFTAQVHPVFMLPPLAASVFGAVLANRVEPSLLALHLLAAFAALYTAHVKDGYVDFHVRGEDDDHPMTVLGCRVALLGASAVFFACALALGVLVGPVATLLTLPGWVVGYLHAPQLDLHPVGATAGYPTGIAFALLGGHYVQAGAISPTVLAFAAVFLVVLSGIKTVDDAKDHGYDRSIGKRTVAVVLGPRAARTAAYGLMTAGMGAVVVLALAGVFPPSSVGAVAVFAVVAGVAYRAEPSLATKLLIRGSYLFLAALVAAVWFRPLG